MKLTQDDIAYLNQKGASQGYGPDDINNLLKAINYESRGDATRWCGKDNNYFGLIQFGKNERKQFGVDTENPNAQNQIDATFAFLNKRGYKPGMGMLDLYSTINAGSPGHYNASDGNGMVASHVAKMTGMTAPPVASGIQQPTGGLLANPVAASPMARPQIGGLLDYAKITAPPGTNRDLLPRFYPNTHG